MKTISSLITSIENLLDTAVNAEFALLRMPVVRRGEHVTWANSDNRPDGDVAHGTLDEYLAQLDADAYSAILCDGSLIQMEYQLSLGEVRSHRLAYYPCPFRIDTALLDEFPLREVIEASFAIEHVLLRTPVRFDYAPRDDRDDHAASHVHLNHAECRMSLCAPLSPGGFVRFIARNFYPHEWRALEALRSMPMSHLKRSIRPVQESEWYLNQQRHR